MKNLWTFPVLACFALASCKTEKHDTKLTIIDSFKINTIVPDSDNPDELIYNIGTRMRQDDGTFSLVYFSTKDSAIVIQSMYPVANKIQRISLHSTFDGDQIFPNSFAMDGDKFYLYYKNGNIIKELDLSGKLVSKMHIKLTDTSDELLASATYPMDYNNGKFYLAALSNSERTKNNINAYCDIVFERKGDTLIPTAHSGRYPSNYSKDYVKFREFNRVLFPSGAILYCFKGSDSVFKANKPTTEGAMSFVSFTKANGVTKYDTSKMTDMKYLFEYYKLSEQNMFAKFNQANSLVYIIKKLKKQTINDPENFELVAIDNENKKVVDLTYKNELIRKDIFFMKDKYLFTGSLFAPSIVRYELQ